MEHRPENLPFRLVISLWEISWYRKERNGQWWEKKNSWHFGFSRPFDEIFSHSISFLPLFPPTPRRALKILHGYNPPTAWSASTTPRKSLIPSRFIQLDVERFLPKDGRCHDGGCGCGDSSRWSVDWLASAVIAGYLSMWYMDWLCNGEWYNRGSYSHLCSLSGISTLVFSVSPNFASHLHTSRNALSCKFRDTPIMYIAPRSFDALTCREWLEHELCVDPHWRGSSSSCSVVITGTERILFRRAVCWVDPPAFIRFPGNLWRCILLRYFILYCWSHSDWSISGPLCQSLKPLLL